MGGRGGTRTLFQALVSGPEVEPKASHLGSYLVYSSYLSAYQGLCLTPSLSPPPLRGHSNCWQGFGSRAPANFFQANQRGEVEVAAISAPRKRADITAYSIAL